MKPTVQAKTANPTLPTPNQFWVIPRSDAIAEMGGLDDLDKDQFWMAQRSAAYRALMRGIIENPNNGDLHSLNAIWDRSGRPVDKVPAEWLAGWLADSAKNNEGDIYPDRDDEVVEDRGESGLWVGFELAAWYAHSLDPEVFEVVDVLDMCY